MQNLVLTRSGSGALFTATEDSLRHRLVRFADLSAPGSYRVTVETRYAGTSQMAIEIGGPGQPYAIVKVNLKDGVVTDSQGALGAGVDQLSKPGSYRWWVDLDLNPGRVYYNFELLSWAGAKQFPGSGVCKVFVNAPGVMVQSSTTHEQGYPQ